MMLRNFEQWGDDECETMDRIPLIEFIDDTIA